MYKNGKFESYEFLIDYVHPKIAFLIIKSDANESEEAFQWNKPAAHQIYVVASTQAHRYKRIQGRYAHNDPAVINHTVLTRVGNKVIIKLPVFTTLPIFIVKCGICECVSRNMAAAEFTTLYINVLWIWTSGLRDGEEALFQF